MKHVVENRMHDEEVEVNTSLNLGNMKLEKSVVEVIKGIESNINSLEYMQHKYGDNWELIDAEAMHVFECCTTSMIKCTSEINKYGDRIKNIENAMLLEYVRFFSKLKIGSMC